MYSARHNSDRQNQPRGAILDEMCAGIERGNFYVRNNFAGMYFGSISVCNPFQGTIRRMFYIPTSHSLCNEKLMPMENALNHARIALFNIINAVVHVL